MDHLSSPFQLRQSPHPLETRDRKRDLVDNNNNSSSDNSNNSGGETKEIPPNSTSSSTILDKQMNRRPRGRPTGSKNKPKPPIIIARESANALKTHVLEISSGCDISDSISSFARRRQRGVCILSGNGTVTNVSLRQPSSMGTVVSLQGRFEILSLAGCFLPPPAPQSASGLTVYLAGGQGQVVGKSLFFLSLTSPSLSNLMFFRRERCRSFDCLRTCDCNGCFVWKRGVREITTGGRRQHGAAIRADDTAAIAADGAAAVDGFKSTDISGYGWAESSE